MFERTCRLCKEVFQSNWHNNFYCPICLPAFRRRYISDWQKSNPQRTLLHGAKFRAIKKGLEFDLKEEDIKLPEVCPILGITLKYNQGRPGFYNDSYSLDRIDPNKGYTKDNIRVISNRANLLKSNATIEELEKILKDAYLHRH